MMVTTGSFEPYKEQNGRGVTMSNTENKAAPKYRFVPVIKGARKVQEMTASTFAQLAQGKRKQLDPKFTLQEIFNGKTWVHPYYDNDHKYESEFTNDEELRKEQEKEYVSFKALVEKLHPGKEVVYAQRHGVIGDQADDSRKYKYKISYRAWVQGVKMIVADIPVHVRSVLGLGPKDVHPTLDLSVFKDKEQLLGVVYGCKDIDTVKRYLIPLDGTEPLMKFLAQNVDPDGIEDEIFKPDGPINAVAEKKAGTGKRGRPRKVDSDGAVIPTVTELATSESLSGPEYSDTFEAATDFFGDRYRMQERFVKVMVDRVKKCLVFPTTKKWCFILKDSHQGNNAYVVVTENGSRWKCFDEVCKGKGDVKLIPFKDLPSEVQKLYMQIFYGDTVTDEIITYAAEECKQDIHDNFPEEVKDELNPGFRPQESMVKMVTKLAKQKCRALECGSSNIDIAYDENGWCTHCQVCGKKWPKKPVPIDPAELPRLMAAFKQLNVTVNNNLCVTINNYGGGAAEFYADFTNDQIEFFDDPQENRLFIGSLQGTDTMLSRFTSYHFRNRFHCTDTEKWFRYEGHCWHEAPKHYYKEAMAKDEFLFPYRQVAMNFENSPIQTDEFKRKARMLRRLCQSLEDGSCRDRIVADSIMKFHEMRPTFELLLNSQNVMVFDDGVFDFDSMTFHAGSPDVPITMCVPQPYIPYDPNSEHVKILMGFMKDLLPDEGTREYTLKFLGICLTHEVLQQFFIWTGKGGNGKGRLVRLMEECLGPYYQAVNPTMLTRKREDANQANEALMSLVTARFAVFQEAEATDCLQAGIVKSITGDDTQTSRQNYGRQRKFRPAFKCLFVCNDLPTFSESTWALWRRVKCTNFPTAFVEEPVLAHERKVDPNLDRKLKDAAPHFIGVLIEYLRRYKSDGLREPTLVTSATAMYRDSLDTVKDFIDSRLQKSEGSVIPWTDLIAAYNKWPERKYMRSQQLKEQFMKHGVEYKNTTHENKKFCGIKGWALI